jgi:site-specific recombinase XerD
LGDVVSARQGKRLPVVLTVAEVQAVLARVTGTTGLMLRLLYGSGLRLMECTRLRVKDVDFGQGQILVRDGKGDKDRVTMLPQSLVEPLQTHLERVQVLHRAAILKRAMARSICPMRLIENIRMQAGNGVGSMSSLPASGRSIRVPAWCDATMRMRRCCSGR